MYIYIHITFITWIYHDKQLVSVIYIYIIFIYICESILSLSLYIYYIYTIYVYIYTIYIDIHIHYIYIHHIYTIYHLYITPNDSFSTSRVQGLRLRPGRGGGSGQRPGTAEAGDKSIGKMVDFMVG